MARKPRPVEAEEPLTAEPASQPTPAVRAVTYSSFDGLKLHADDYGDALSPWLPVVCLPGLTRSARDFREIAGYLSTHRFRPRRVVAFEYRGRGRSQWDTNVDNYNPLTEMADIFDGMAALGIARAIVVGTSWGGIIAVLMGVARPTMLAGIVLNDIGPVIEARGLARIKTYVGRTPAPNDWTDAKRILQRLHGAQFTAFSEDDWDVFARMTYRDEAGRPAGDYDPALAETFDGVEFDKPVPDLWNEFKSLGPIPVLAIRGDNSDLLSEETLDEMTATHPRFESLTIAGEGHAPHLRKANILQRISSFITSVEGATPPAEAVIPIGHIGYDVDEAQRVAEQAPAD